MKMYTRYLLLIIAVALSACGSQTGKKEELKTVQSTVNFNSSDPELIEAWKWAKAKALSYVRQGDPVGPW
jgi:hypothetical protein